MQCPVTRHTKSSPDGARVVLEHIFFSLASTATTQATQPPRGHSSSILPHYPRYNALHCSIKTECCFQMTFAFHGHSPLLSSSRSLRQKPRMGGQINYREEEKRILDSILGRDVYDNRIRPSGLNGTGMCNACNPFMHKSFYLTCFLFFRRGHHHCRQLIHSQFRQNRRRENGKLQWR